LSDHSHPTTYEVLRAHGIERRDFLKFCVKATAAMGLSASFIPQVVHALETKPRIPVIWLHGLECTCCSESFIRASHPIVQDIILNMISLDVDDTLMAAAGAQVEEVQAKIMKEYKGKYLLAVEGNAPTADGGVYCTVGGETFLSQLQRTAADAAAIIAWGSCASNGCVQAAHPNPTGAKPVHATVDHKAIVNVPGCPPIANVMVGVITYLLTFDRLPELDRLGRPKMFYGQRVHDNCIRRAYFDAGQYVERWDDDGAKKGWCLYKMGCKGPETYNSCAWMRWNDGVSYPIQSGHGCIGCSEAGFWDNGPFYSHLSNVPVPGIHRNANQIGGALALGTAVGVGAHLATAVVRRAAKGTTPDAEPSKAEKTDTTGRS
jgi:hydrogenase small subunit